MPETKELPTPKAQAGEVSLITPTGLSPAAQLWPSLETSPSQAFLYPTLMSAHEETAIGRAEATRQARQAERQSESLRGAISRKTNTVVGADLRVQLTPDWRALGQTPEWAHDFAAQGEALIRSWCIDRRKVCDAEGDNTFGGMMWLAFRNLIGPDGETFGIIHYDVKRARDLGTKWATTVTVLDPQRVATPPEHVGKDNVVDGKLVDPYGRMLGFYFNHMPRGVDLTGDMAYSFVPRETKTGRPMGWHHFAKTRGAMQRGITNLVNILKKSGMLDKFDGAQLGAAIVAAAMATYVESTQDSEDVRENLSPARGNDTLGAAEFGRLALYDKLKLRIGAQRIPVLPRGDKIQISAVDRGSGDSSGFRGSFQREFASALNMTAEQFSLDYSNVNYSSARASIVDIQRGVVAERSFFFPAVPALIIDALVEEAIVKGWLPTPAGAPSFYEAREAYTRCNFTGPAMGWVDPQKEAQAAILRTDPSRPLSTLTDEAASQGYSFEEIVETTARERRMLVDAGLIPSVMAAPMPGQTMPGDPNAPDPTSTEDPPAPPKPKRDA